MEKHPQKSIIRNNNRWNQFGVYLNWNIPTPTYVYPITPLTYEVKIDTSACFITDIA